MYTWSPMQVQSVYDFVSLSKENQYLKCNKIQPREDGGDLKFKQY